MKTNKHFSQRDNQQRCRGGQGRFEACGGGDMAGGKKSRHAASQPRDAAGRFSRG